MVQIRQTMFNGAIMTKRRAPSLTQERVAFSINHTAGDKKVGSHLWTSLY